MYSDLSSWQQKVRRLKLFSKQLAQIPTEVTILSLTSTISMGASEYDLRTRVFLVVVLLVVLTILIMRRNESRKVHMERNWTNIIGDQTNTSAGQKLILFYTTLWGNKLWPGFETSARFNNWGGRACKVQNCRVTYNKKMISKADVVIFHAFGSDMPSERHVRKLSKSRRLDSFWIYFIHESPHNARPSPLLYDNLFNWTMGYRTDADITVPYNWEWGHWQQADTKATFSEVPRNYAEGKDKLIYGAISHCGCMRERYIRKFMEYVTIDVYGSCSGRFHATPKVCVRDSPECVKLKARYKFFIAFENSFCIDYASEKFTETVMDGNHVPIVMGGADYKKIGLPGSYIDVNDFDTIEELANYIRYLDDNDEEYNKFFRHKQHFILGPPQSWSCKICEMINDESVHPKRYDKLGDWYSVKNQCGVKLKRLRDILQKSGVPGPYVDEYYKHESDNIDGR